MSSYALTPIAKADIFRISYYIANDSVDAAGRVEQAILDGCRLLADAPMMGHARKDLTKRPLRFWVLARYPNYTLVPSRDKTT